VSVGNDGAPDAQGSDAQDTGAPDTSTPTDAVADQASDAPSSDATSADSATAIAKGCYRTCNSNNDCPRITGQPQDYLCDTAAHHCVVCLHDITCIAQSSGWVSGASCANDADCTGGSLGDYCVDVDGVGRCAFDKTNPSATPGDPCFDLADVITVKKLGSATMVEVCGDLSQTCDTTRGECVTACTANPSCTPIVGGKVCNTTTHKCECGSNTDCGGTRPTCNTTLKQCECSSTASCTTDGSASYVCE
jgi:hypothetical protein